MQVRRLLGTRLLFIGIALAWAVSAAASQAGGRPTAHTSRAEVPAIVLGPIDFGTAMLPGAQPSAARRPSPAVPALSRLFVPASKPDANRLIPDEFGTVCGLRMKRVSPDIDPRMLIQTDRGAGIRVRRIVPEACRAAREP